MMASNKRGSTPRVARLLDELKERAMTDRSREWFTPEMLKDIAPDENARGTPVIERRAMAFAEMLEAMTREDNSRCTHTYEIAPGELIVGTMPQGSLGLGKVFPNYLTDTEKQVAFFSSRGVTSTLGHNSPDLKRVLTHGLKSMIDICNERIEFLKLDRDYPMGRTGGIIKKISFYEAVRMCCRAVKNYAKAFADLAERMAAEETDPKRKKELAGIARICRHVPYRPARTFHEALQSIWFVHLASHSTVSHMSIGRLDQLLQPYLEKSLAAGEIDRGQAVELLECFFIKAAGRLNLNPDYFEKQDHTDFGTSMGHSPFLVDQAVTVNQFMQNIVVGGQTRDGKDAANECSHLILEAGSNLGLPTPTLNVRLHKNSSDEFRQKVAECVVEGGNGQPVVYNDEVVIPGLMYTTKQGASRSWTESDAREYVVDGCWEVVLNGKSDFTYNMVNVLTVLECALNGGALLTGSSMQLRGIKQSFMTKLPSEIATFDDLKEAFRTHLQLFTNRAGMELYDNYSLEGSVTPTPFFSALLGDCLKKGIDKTWGGADHTIGAIVFIALPNVANSLAAIRQLVFDRKAYTLEEVTRALRDNFHNAEAMERAFRDCPKFGNNDQAVDEIMAWLTDEVSLAVSNAQHLADDLFLKIPRGSREGRRISALRNMAGYSGISMRERFGRNFGVQFTIGFGTFAQYVHFGEGCAASADGRHSGDPVAPNFSPASGSAVRGVGGVLESLKGLGLDRFGCGVIIDLCLEESTVSAEFVREVMGKFVEAGGSILTLTIAKHSYLKEIYECCNAVREGEESGSVLAQYNDISVRVGGWNGVFTTLTKAQQEDYLKRTLRNI